MKLTIKVTKIVILFLFALQAIGNNNTYAKDWFTKSVDVGFNSFVLKPQITTNEDIVLDAQPTTYVNLGIHIRGTATINTEMSLFSGKVFSFFFEYNEFQFYDKSIEFETSNVDTFFQADIKSADIGLFIDFAPTIDWLQIGIGTAYNFWTEIATRKFTQNDNNYQISIDKDTLSLHYNYAMIKLGWKKIPLFVQIKAMLFNPKTNTIIKDIKGNTASFGWHKKFK